MFITFEGGEGSGKSTQIQKLTEALRAEGYLVELTREPGGTAIGDQIRKVLLDSQNVNMVPLCEMLLYWAARAQHIEEKIKPWLMDGRIVLCDRFVDSTVVYQGYARNLNRKTIAELNQLVCGDFAPHLTLVMDIDVEEGLRRAKARMQGLADKEDRFENEVVEFHHRVQEGFLDLAQKYPERIVLVNAAQSEEAVHQEVLSAVHEKLSSRETESL